MKRAKKVLSTGAVVAFLSVGWVEAARADNTTSAPEESTTATSASAAQAHYPRVGGHVGTVVPLTTVSSNGATAIGRDFVNIGMAAGATVKINARLAFDFESVVVDRIDVPGQATQLVVDPGFVYDAGPLAAGIRVAGAIGGATNLGLIPLLNKGFKIGEDTSFFVELDLPTFLREQPSASSSNSAAAPSTTKAIAWTTQFHVGVGF